MSCDGAGQSFGEEVVEDAGSSKQWAKVSMGEQRVQQSVLWEF
jgi:hypothetical protein